MDTATLRQRYAELVEAVIPPAPDGISVWAWEPKRTGTPEQQAEYSFIQDELMSRDAQTRDATREAYLRHEEAQDLPHRSRR